MKEAAIDVLQHRETRDLARETFDMRLALVKNDLEARGVGSRIVHRFTDKASAGASEAREIAENHKGVVAGTIAALAVWFLRNPIIAWIEGFLDEGAYHDDEDYFA